MKRTLLPILLLSACTSPALLGDQIAAGLDTADGGSPTGAAQPLACSNAALLSGNYRLDFYASAGSCANEAYVDATLTMVTTDIQSDREDTYPIGAFCHDRHTSDTPPPTVATCSTYVETNTLADDCRAFDSTWTGPVVINGVGERRKFSRFTLQAVSATRLQADLVGYDREGVVEQPIFRCFYDRQ